MRGHEGTRRDERRHLSSHYYCHTYPHTHTHIDEAPELVAQRHFREQAHTECLNDCCTTVGGGRDSAGTSLVRAQSFASISCSRTINRIDASPNLSQHCHTPHSNACSSRYTVLHGVAVC